MIVMFFYEVMATVVLECELHSWFSYVLLQNDDIRPLFCNC